MPLFKYFPPERVDVIERGLIRFTPAGEFNDPFECLPDSRLIEDPRWQREIEDHCVFSMLEDPEIRRSWGSLNNADLGTHVRKLYRERYHIRMPELKVIARDRLVAARLPLRILCLAQVPPESADAFLMWGHYTNNHKGFVIEFDNQHQWFSDHLYVDGEGHDAGPVKYLPTRPGWAFDANGKAQPRYEFVFTKSPHWAYEQEYRLIRLVGTPGLETANTLSLLAFPLEAIRSVTFGVQCAPQTKERLVAACQLHALRSVRFKQANVDPDEYALRFCDYDQM